MATASRGRVGKKPGTRRGVGAKRLPRGRQPSPQEAALADVARVLKALDAPSAIIGGIAVITWGHARLTADIDCAIAAPTSKVRAILNAFERGGFEARDDDPIGFAEANSVLLLRHRATSIQVDVSLAQFEFEQIALSSAVSRTAVPTREERDRERSNGNSRRRHLAPRTQLSRQDSRHGR